MYQGGVYADVRDSRCVRFFAGSGDAPRRSGRAFGTIESRHHRVPAQQVVPSRGSFKTRTASRFPVFAF